MTVMPPPAPADARLPTTDDVLLVRPDPVANRIPGQEAVYGAIQALWSAHARRRFRTDFQDVRAFALFIGYPRSGHSVVGAMLNAHRHAVISHELDAPRLVVDGADRDALYARILARAAWFNLRGNTSNYRYQVPGQWQGRFESLHLMGDKGGGWAAQWMERHPDLLDRIRDTVGVPLRLLHVVRNPWDNIAAISQWHRLSLDESIDFYFSHCAVTGALADREDVLTVRHEAFITASDATLEALCAFVGLECDDRYRAACTSILFGRPTGSRRRVQWDAAQVREVAQRARPFPFLAGYDYDAREGGEDGDARAGVAPTVARGPSAASRLAAWVNPRIRPASASREA
jgi:Sulfotransferase family